MSAAPQENPGHAEAAAGFGLSLLGEVALTAPGGQALAITGKKNRALLAVLALSPGRTMSRERVAGLLWGDRGEEQARNSLRQSLAVLRKELGPAGSWLVVSRDEALTLQLDAAAVDALEIAAATASRDVARLRAAAARCRGELLAGMALHEDSFEEWVAVERASFAAARLRLFERLAELEQGPARVAAAQHLVDLDPLRESSQRLLMQAYSDAGDNACTGARL